jgi:predicted ester cyclase
MSAETAKELARRVWDEGWNQGRLEVVDEALTTDAVDRHEHDQEDFRGHLKDAIAEFRRGFPDLHAELADIVAEGDRVAMRVVLTGTHDGPFFGNQPSGRPVSIEQFHFVQVNPHGQCIRHWANIGLDDLFRQIGASPAGSQGPYPPAGQGQA